MNKAKKVFALHNVTWILFLCIPVILLYLAGWENIKSWILEVCSFVWVGAIFTPIIMFNAHWHLRKSKYREDNPIPEADFKICLLEDAYKWMLWSAVISVISWLALWLLVISHRWPWFN